MNITEEKKDAMIINNVHKYSSTNSIPLNQNISFLSKERGEVTISSHDLVMAQGIIICQLSPTPIHPKFSCKQINTRENKILLKRKKNSTCQNWNKKTRKIYHFLLKAFVRKELADLKVTLLHGKSIFRKKLTLDLNNNNYPYKVQSFCDNHTSVEA